MRVSNWVAFPVYAISTSALVIPNTGPSNDAVAGSIAHLNTTNALDQPVDALQTEYEKLEVLKHQLFALHHEVLKQEREIFVLINKDFKSCSGVRCYLQTALRKAPDFFELLKTHFRHHPKNATVSDWDCLWTGKKSEAQDPSLGEVDVVDGAPLSTEDQLFHLGDDISAPQPPSSDVFDDGFDHDSKTHPPPPPPPPPDTNDEFFDFGITGDDRPPHDWHHDHHGPPPPHDSEYEPWKENPNPPAPHPHHKGPHHFHMPHPAPRHRHFKLILATAGFVVTVFILAILFKALHLYLNNPRLKADRAARREEYRTRREYRRAACQHKFRQTISRLCPRRRRRSDSGTDDYEEKRAILERANNFDAANHIIGADINSLRRAHEIVGRLMRAEEGRIHDCSPLQQPEQQEPIASSSRSIRSVQTMTTLPLYAPPPPRYSQELARDMEVVDGFSYTPSQSDVTIASSASSFILDDGDLCTESSVVDCRSRLSMDTESIAPSQTRETSRNRKSLELAGDRFRGQFH